MGRMKSLPYQFIHLTVQPNSKLFNLLSNLGFRNIKKLEP